MGVITIGTSTGVGAVLEEGPGGEERGGKGGREWRSS